MKQKRRDIFARFKTCLALCLVCCVSFALLTGCTPSDSDSGSTAVSSKYLGETLQTQIENESISLSCDTLCSYGDETFSKNFEYLYGIPEEYVSDGFILYAASGSVADEVSLLLPADAGKGALVQSALLDRIEQRIRDFNGYNDLEVKKLQQAVVKPLGSNLVLIVSNNPDAVLKTLRQALKEKAQQNETENDK